MPHAQGLRPQNTLVARR